VADSKLIEELFDTVIILLTNAKGYNQLNTELLKQCLLQLSTLSLAAKNWKFIVKKSIYQHTLLRLLAIGNHDHDHDDDDDGDSDIQQLAAEIMSHCSGSSTKHETKQISVAPDLVISIRQEADNSENGLGWKLWDSSAILSRWIYENHEIFHGKTVLELGSGCGLVGIVAAHYARHVTFSDYLPALLDNLLYNIGFNFPPPPPSPSTNSNFHPSTEVVKIDWDEIDDDSKPPVTMNYTTFDIIIGSDLVYQFMDPGNLVKVIVKYLSGKPGSHVYLVLPTNRVQVHDFLDTIASNSTLQACVSKVHHAMDDEICSPKEFFFCEYSVKVDH